MKGKILLKDHPSSQMIDQFFFRRSIKSQHKELDTTLQRLKNVYIFGDEDNDEPNGDMVNYALISPNFNILLFILLLIW